MKWRKCDEEETMDSNNLITGNGSGGGPGVPVAMREIRRRRMVIRRQQRTAEAERAVKIR